MNEKKWTDDERDEAFDRGMETMQRVALELYRRGREPLLEELETVKRERDEARADLARSVTAWESAGMQGRTAHDAMLALAKERDEARADAERYLADLRRCASEPYERTRELEALQAEVGRLREMAHDFEAMRQDRDEARAELSKLREDYDSVLEANVGLLDGAPYVDARAAFRRGAEAMREACARWMSEREGIAQWVYDDALSALPIPEEP